MSGYRGTDVAPDGSPVEVYLRLPERREGGLVAHAIGPPASLLELGCGAGRVTRQLRRLGYDVVAVDESSAMLAHVDDAETVCARIEELDLGRRFALRIDGAEGGVVRGEVFYDGGGSHACAMRVFADEGQLWFASRRSGNTS